MQEAGLKSLTLELDFVLNNKRVVLVVNRLGEFGGDGVVSSLVLDDQALVTLHALEHGRLLNGPGSNVCPFLVIGLDILLCVRRLPSVLPVVCELLEEWRLELGGLEVAVSCNPADEMPQILTVKVGLATEVDVDDSASAALASSARTTAAASA